MTMATWSSRFLGNRSASLPQIGVEAVEARSIAVTTHVYCDWLPLRVPTICGRATETMVELIIAANRTMSRPLRARSTSRWVIGAAAVFAGALMGGLRRWCWERAEPQDLRGRG